VYVDEAADLDGASTSSCERQDPAPEVQRVPSRWWCIEAVADEFLPRACGALTERGVELVGDAGRAHVCRRWARPPMTTSRASSSRSR
jgi:hypothetical protein